MAIKRIKKMILGLFCLISSTSALAYNFLPAYAPALVVEKPRAERAQPVVETPVAAAIAIPASQTGLTPVQPARTAAVAAPAQPSEVAVQTATVDEKWVAAWIPVPPLAQEGDAKYLVSEWVNLPQPAQSATTEARHSDLFAAASAQSFTIEPGLKLQPRPVRFVAGSLPKILNSALSARSIDPQEAPPALAPNKDLQTVAIAAFDPRPVISLLMNGSPIMHSPEVRADAAPPVQSAIEIAAAQAPVNVETRSMLALPAPPKAFRGIVAIVTDPRPEISWVLGGPHAEDAPDFQNNHSGEVLEVASALQKDGLQLPSLAPLRKQPLVHPSIQPMATLIRLPQTEIAATPVFAPKTISFGSVANRSLLAMPTQPIFVPMAKPASAVGLGSELALVQAAAPVPSDTRVARGELSMPDAPRPVTERMAETLKNPVPLISYALFGPKVEALSAAPAAVQPDSMPAPRTVAMAKDIAAPIAITGQITLGQAVLASLENRVESTDPLPTMSAGGPSWTPSDNASVTASAVSEMKPVTITASTGFSSDFLRPMSTRPVFPPNPDSYAVSAPLPGQATQPGGYCDPNFVGPPIRFAQTVDLRLDDLLSQLNARFGVNFIVGPDVGKTPLNVKAGSIPWNILLRSQLYVSGIKAECINNDTVQLVLNSKVGELEKGMKEGEKLETRYIKLKYLQPSSGGNQNVAGQNTSGGGTNQSGQGGQNTSDCQQGAGGSGGGGLGGGTGGGAGSTQQLPQRCKFERLMSEIRQMLGLNNQGSSAEVLTDNSGNGGQRQSVYKLADETRRPYVGQVPGRNMLIVNAAPSQLDEIQELIKHADVPPFQVVIKALIYTANEDKLKDIGVQTSIVNIGTGKNSGSFIGHTLGSGSLFDLSTIIGTVQFDVQASALQQNGVISVKSRPFAAVLDGDTTLLTVGRQVPVVVTATNNFGGNAGTVTILQAANQLSVTPHVIDDDHGNPIGVNLELRLESNDTDAPTGQGIPTVQARSIQSNFNLNQEQTAILGGFTVDSDNKTLSKTPGLGDLPVLGELFKRRVRTSQINRLYFAISVEVIPYGGPIEPVQVPGSSPDPPTITPTMLKRAEAAEPPKAVPSPTPKH